MGDIVVGPYGDSPRPVLGRVGRNDGRCRGTWWWVEVGDEVLRVQRAPFDDSDVAAWAVQP